MNQPELGSIYQHSVSGLKYMILQLLGPCDEGYAVRTKLLVWPPVTGFYSDRMIWDSNTMIKVSKNSDTTH